MNRKLNGGFLSLILVSLIAVGCVCQNETEDCRGAFECGGLRDIGYPFYGGNRSLSCGFPGFELTCQGEGAPFLNISSLVYRVIAINNQTQVLRVARNDLWSTLCTPSRLNTTLGNAPYSFYSTAGDQDITLYYGCIGELPQLIPQPNRFDCNSATSFFVTREASVTALGFNVTCSSGISVRVNQTAAGQLADSATASTTLLQTSLQSGFSIQWSAENDRCRSCVGSNGTCGYNQGSSSFTCYCSDGSYDDSTCPDQSSTYKFTFFLCFIFL